MLYVVVRNVLLVKHIVWWVEAGISIVYFPWRMMKVYEVIWHVSPCQPLKQMTDLKGMDVVFFHAIKVCGEVEL
jgi:hypothetical protein